MARRVARPLYWFTRAFRPLVAALNGASNAILRLLRVNPSVAFEEGGTPEDLKLLIAQSLEGGQLAADEALMLAGVKQLNLAYRYEETGAANAVRVGRVVITIDRARQG